MTQRLSKVYFVTGGAGFVGSALVKQLVSEGKEVHLLLKTTTNSWRLAECQEKIHQHVGDLNSIPSLKKLLTKIQPDVIYHLATRGAYASQNQPNDCFETNVQGTWNLLVATQAIPYRLLVNVGSSSEYGYSSEPMSEAQLMKPNSWYAATKAAAGLLAVQWAEQAQKPVVHLRLFSVYGPFEQPGRLFPTLLANAYFQRPTQLVAADTARDYIYIDDVVRLFRAETELIAMAGHVLNVGRGEQVPLKEVVMQVEKVTGTSLTPTWGTMTPRPWDTNTWVADMSYVKQHLKWHPTTSLFDGITKMWKWFPAAANTYKD
jgi:nucleoside-diphosphate-sugar epimerase